MVTTYTEKPMLIDTIAKATVPVLARRFVNYQDLLCGDAERAFGVTQYEFGVGEYPAAVCEGIVLIETGGAFPKGAAITSDATGRARLAAPGETINGYAREASTGADEFVPIHLK